MSRAGGFSIAAAAALAAVLAVVGISVSSTTAGFADSSQARVEVAADEWPIFVATYDLRAPGCADTTITLPIHRVGQGTIDWGDGSSPEPATEFASHTYSASDVYTVTVEAPFEHARSSVPPDMPGGGVPPGDTACLISVDEWAGTQTINSHALFDEAINLTHTVQPPKTLTEYQSMFRGATSFNGDISHWDVSTVENMNRMFERAESFNRDISSWDTGQLWNMHRLFDGASSFNQDLSSWDTSQVTRMDIVFHEATSFNGDISGWSLDSVENMNRMFEHATSFDRDLSHWQIPAGATTSRFDEGATSWRCSYRPAPFGC